MFGTTSLPHFSSVTANNMRRCYLPLWCYQSTYCTGFLLVIYHRNVQGPAKTTAFFCEQQPLSWSQWTTHAHPRRRAIPLVDKAMGLKPKFSFSTTLLFELHYSLGSQPLSSHFHDLHPPLRITASCLLTPRPRDISHTLSSFQADLAWCRTPRCQDGQHHSFVVTSGWPEFSVVSGKAIQPFPFSATHCHLVPPTYLSWWKQGCIVKQTREAVWS